MSLNIDEEINQKLNDYIPNLILDFTVFNCKYIFVDENFDNQRQYLYEVKNNKFITFLINDISVPGIDGDKLRASGYIENKKMHLTFSRIDFVILTWVLGDDYPFNKGMLDETKAGEVKVIFDKIR